MPPHRSLGFNPNVTVDDAMLLSEYISAGKLSQENAAKVMSKDIASLRRLLQNNSSCCFGELGTFHMNIKGDISFVAADNAIDDPYNFGFEPLTMPLLSQCNEKTIVIKRKEFSRYIAIAAAVILAFFFVTPVSDSAYERGMHASIAQITTAGGNKVSVAEPVEVTEPKVVDEVAEHVIAPVAESVTGNFVTMPAEPETVTTEPAEEPAEVVEVPQKTYSIIVASSPNADNAQLAIKELTRKAKADYTVVVGGGRHRVSIGDYSNAGEANSALKTVKETFPDAWVLTH